MFNSIISSTDSMISAGTSLASMGVAVVLGVLISVCYMFTQKKGSYTSFLVIGIRCHAQNFKRTGTLPERSRH